MSTNISILGFEFNCNMKLYKLAAAARHAGLTYQMVGLTYGVDNTTDAYKKNVHPYGCAPAIQTEDGYIGESGACLRAIARLEKNSAFLYGRTAFEASQIDMWIDYVTCEIDAHAGYWAGKLFGREEIAAEAQQHLVNLEGALNGVETWLETRTFLVGERLSIADINLAFTLDIAFRYSTDPEGLQKKFRNVFRHYNTVMNQPKTIETLQAHKLAIGIAKAEKKKEEPKKEAKKEEPKPKKEEPKEEADDEDELQFAEDKKKPNPLDSLPPSKFVLDAFKREYSNKDTRKEAAPWFFDNYDPEGFTCFWCKYNYNDELKKTFMTSNLVRGWFQRMEHVRKYAFGSVLIVGEESKHEVVGFWVFRGKGLPEIVSEVEDTVLYTWTEIPDVKKEQGKITDYLAWDGATFATTPVLEGRAFK